MSYTVFVTEATKEQIARYAQYITEVCGAPENA